MMINLLPPELKSSYRYAHRNVSLLRWTVVCVLSLVGIAAISTFGLIYIQQTSRSYDSQVSAAQTTLRDQHLSATQAQVKDISSSLQLAVQVLSKEVLFSKLLTQIATITPTRVVLTDLSITQAQTSMDVTALAADYKSATQLQVNLSDPANKLFTRADIVSISCATTVPSAYPCDVTIRALFAKDNPYLFINDGKVAP